MVYVNDKNYGNFGVNATLLSHKKVMWMNWDNDPATPDFIDGAIERWGIDSIGFWGRINEPSGIARINATIENAGEAFFDAHYGAKTRST